MPGYTRDQLDFGVTLHRMWMGSPDDIGTRDQWNQLLFQLFNRQPFTGIWKINLWIWDMRHPDLVQRVANGQECLLDNSKTLPGKQVVYGRTIDGLIEIGIVPSGWDENNTDWGILEWKNVQLGMDVLSHESGHNQAQKSKLPPKPDSPQITKDIWYNFISWRPKKAENAEEDWAEVFHGICGSDRSLGYYSDWVRATLDPRVITVIRTAYWLSCNLANTEYLNLTFDSTHVYWDKLEWVQVTYWAFWTYWEKRVTGKYRLNHKWQTEKLVNGTWIAV